MQTYMARLGSFQFGIDTAAFQELQRSSSYQWQAKNRIGRQPAQQNTGRGADTITLQGVIYPHYRGGLGQLAAMRAQAAAGDPLPLIYSFETVGQYCGLWCVTAIEETRTVFFDNGTPRKIEFSLSLVEYGEDAGAGLAAVVGEVVALANAGVSAASAAQEASDLGAEVATVATAPEALSMAGQVAAVASGVASTIQNGVNAVLNSEAVTLARTVVSEINKMQGAVAGLRSAVESVRGIASNPASALTAFGNLAASAGSVSTVLGSVSTQLGQQAGAYDGKSSGSFFRNEIGQVTSALSSLSAAAGSLQTASAHLRGIVT